MKWHQVNPFIRAHGSSPGPLIRPVLTATLASLCAGLLMSIVYEISSMEFHTEAQVSVLSLLLGTGLYCLISGTVYGRVYRRAINDHRGGWIFGASTGFILWMVNPLIWLPWFGLDPFLVGRPALAFLFAHVLHGALMGVFSPSLQVLQKRFLRSMSLTVPD